MGINGQNNNYYITPKFLELADNLKGVTNAE
jgi:hypothetical protein